MDQELIQKKYLAEQTTLPTGLQIALLVEIATDQKRTQKEFHAATHIATQK